MDKTHFKENMRKGSLALMTSFACFSSGALFADSYYVTQTTETGSRDTLVFDLYYNGEFAGGYSSNNFGGQIGYSF